MFCPNCGAEYRQGFTKCSDCDVSLAESPAHPAKEGDATDASRGVVIFVATDPLEAETVQGLLEASGIEVFVADESSPFPGAIGNPKLIVNAAQEALAREVLDEYKAHPDVSSAMDASDDSEPTF